MTIHTANSGREPDSRIVAAVGRLARAALGKKAFLISIGDPIAALTAIGELPHVTSALEGRGGSGKADEVRYLSYSIQEVA